MPIPDEYWKLILEVISERACDLIHHIEDEVPNRPKDSACSEVRCLLFAIRELAERIKPLATPSAILAPAPLVLAPLAPASPAPAPLTPALLVLAPLARAPLAPA